MRVLAFVSTLATERHYRVRELAQLWSLSPNTITRLFAAEPGVIKIDNIGTGKRKHVTLSIPESIASLVHERLGHQVFESRLSRRDPPRIIRLRDLDRGMKHELRKVVKRDIGQQLSNRERIA